MPDPRAWRAIESVHDVVYFAPEADAAYAEVGLRGWWNGYFASRAAALGTPGPAVVTALFHGFAPAMVARAVPKVWTVAEPERVLDARVGLAIACLDPLVPDDLDVAAVADRLDGVVARLDLSGKALAAAHAEVPAHAEPLGRLWQQVSVLREYRGDCHVAVLTAEGVDGACANVLAEACGLTDGRQQGVRGWTDEQWAAARERLHDRGWLTGAGAASAAGRRARQRIEERTDDVAAAGVLAPDGFTDAATALLPLARAVRESGAVPYPNPTATGAPD